MSPHNSTQRVEQQRVGGPARAARSREVWDRESRLLRASLLVAMLERKSSIAKIRDSFSGSKGSPRGKRPRAPIVFEGEMQKRGEVNTAYKPRYCVLAGDELAYYDKKPPADSEIWPVANGSITLSASKVGTFSYDAQVGGDVFGLTVQPDRAQRVYMLLAPTQEAQAQWLEVLQATASARGRRVEAFDEDVDSWENEAASRRRQAEASNRGVIEEARRVRRRPRNQTGVYVTTHPATDHSPATEADRAAHHAAV